MGNGFNQSHLTLVAQSDNHSLSVIFQTQDPKELLRQLNRKNQQLPRVMAH